MVSITHTIDSEPQTLEPRIEHVDSFSICTIVSANGPLRDCPLQEMNDGVAATQPEHRRVFSKSVFSSVWIRVFR